MPINSSAQIFIADDDSDDREFIINALHRNGFVGNIAEFENGQDLSDFLNAHRDDRPDLILLDLNMPIKDGFTTLREVKADSTLQNIPIIILTASSKKEDEQTCFRAGCNHFFNKPLTLEGYNEVARFLDAAFFKEDDGNLSK